MGDEEVKAVQLLHEGIEELPMDYSLLDSQAEFCSRKGRSDLALEIAKRGVISAPSEFGTWARLAEIYVQLEQWDMALLTLNSCPMFTYQDKDAPRLPEPARVSLPLAPETICDEIDDAGAAPEADAVHPTLRRLAAGNYKGTFHKAYMLLTEITKKIGWDHLLKIRSQVFVMEEEYRNEKQTQPSGGSRNASTTALRGTDTPQPNGHVGLSEEPESSAASEPNGEPQAGSSHLDPDVSKPSHSVTVRSGSETPQPQPPNLDLSQQQYTQFQHKRLCERWLDNLFMVLYEDLRIFTIWRTEANQYQQQQLAYKKNAEEWEVLGELAERLHHPDAAVEAWQSCLSMRFSPKAMRGVLGMYERKGDARMMLGALIRLVAWQWRWYSEVSGHTPFHGIPAAKNTAVLTRSYVHHAQAHRGRRCGQSSKHHSGNKLTAAYSGSDPPVCACMCSVQERRRERRDGCRMFASAGRICRHSSVILTPGTLKCVFAQEVDLHLRSTPRYCLQFSAVWKSGRRLTRCRS